MAGGLLILFLLSCSGGLLLILCLGYRSIEAERALERENSRRSILDRLEPHTVGVRSVEASVESYLRHEVAMAGEFVAAPSVETLHRNTDLLLPSVIACQMA